MVNGNLERLVEEPEEAFHRDGLVVAFEGRVIGEVEGFAHGFKILFERGARIWGNKEAEANAEEDVLHECSSQGG